MQRQSEGGAIRLTNKTALALRRCARQERTMAMCAATILTLVMAVIAVLLGLRWLIAVPLMTAAAVLLDAAIFIRSRSRYLSLTAQAMCAEAAARQLRIQKKEQERREQALRDLADVKEDALRAADEAEMPRKEQGEKKAAPLQTAPLPRVNASDTDEDAKPRRELPEEAEDEELPSQPPVRRRRRQASLTVLRKEDAK